MEAERAAHKHSLATADHVRQALFDRLTKMTGYSSALWSTVIEAVERTKRPAGTFTNWTLRCKPGLHGASIAAAERAVRREFPYIKVGVS